MKKSFVYIVTNKKNGVLYIGVTNNLIRRVIEHKRKETKGFTNKYNVDKLVWYESSDDIRYAIEKEKKLKTWNRNWKIREIEKFNPEWKDLFYDIGGREEMLEPDFVL